MIREELHPGERKQSVTDRQTDRQTDRHGVFIELLAAAKNPCHYKDKMVMGPSYLYDANSYNGNMAF